MNNYKIRVNNEAESREAQELLFCLGCEWPNGREFSASHNKGQNAIGFFEDKEICLVWVYPDTSPRFQELTLPQLRDLVVLHRNDVKDATHVGKSGSEYYVTDIEVVYFFDGMEWVQKNVDVSNLKPIQKPQPEQGLISGADALRALANGEEVQQWDGNIWWDVEGNYQIDVFRCGKYKFRLKPRTIKLEIEVPAPFQPKVGDIYFIVHPAFKSGYTCNTFVDTEKHKEFVKYGAWRTVEDIKIVVEQLRKLKEYSK